MRYHNLYRLRIKLPKRVRRLPQPCWDRGPEGEVAVTQQPLYTENNNFSHIAHTERYKLGGTNTTGTLSL